MLSQWILKQSKKVFIKMGDSWNSPLLEWVVSGDRKHDSAACLELCALVSVLPAARQQHLHIEKWEITRKPSRLNLIPLSSVIQRCLKNFGRTIIQIAIIIKEDSIFHCFITIQNSSTKSLPRSKKKWKLDWERRLKRKFHLSSISP